MVDELSMVRRASPLDTGFIPYFCGVHTLSRSTVLFRSEESLDRFSLISLISLRRKC
jgi:hypothetical protein